MAKRTYIPMKISKRNKAWKELAQLSRISGKQEIIVTVCKLVDCPFPKTTHAQSFHWVAKPNEFHKNGTRRTYES